MQIINVVHCERTHHQPRRFNSMKSHNRKSRAQISSDKNAFRTSCAHGVRSTIRPDVSEREPRSELRLERVARATDETVDDLEQILVRRVRTEAVAWIEHVEEVERFEEQSE